MMMGTGWIIDERTGYLVETPTTRFMAERGWASGVPGAANGLLHNLLLPPKGVSPFAWRPQEVLHSHLIIIHACYYNHGMVCDAIGCSFS
jgi:hypothetical protein